MASSMKHLFFALAAISLLAPLKPVAAAATKEGASESRRPGLPIMVVRESSGSQPNIYLGWMSWKGAEPFKPFLEPFAQAFQQPTQAISEIVLESIPGAKPIYQQIDQAGNQLSGYLNPATFMGQLSGGGPTSGSGPGNGSPNPLQGLLANLGRRR